MASWVLGAMVTWLLVGGQWTGAQEAPAEPEEIDVAWDVEDGDAEHLLRGAMHEAFAAPVPFNPEPGIVVPKEPPAPINEMPPEMRPDADSIWLEGYWAWDDELEEFIWISGVYRVPPPGRRWVPGNWRKVAEGHQWNAGFWAALEQDELAYLPDPPETVERGPTSPAPSEEHFWATGHWYHDSNEYVWRPGYWVRGHERWIWIPAHYVWTPRGCIFVAGYWDYRLNDRGMCFAPVYWRRPVYLQTGFYYRPARVIDLVRLHLHLFVRPSYCHYYYGDWYGPSRFGIHASFAFHGRYGYDLYGPTTTGTSGSAASTTPNASAAGTTTLGATRIAAHRVPGEPERNSSRNIAISSIWTESCLGTICKSLPSSTRAA
jgi:hypothetical protein